MCSESGWLADDENISTACFLYANLLRDNFFENLAHNNRAFNKTGVVCACVQVYINNK